MNNIKYEDDTKPILIGYLTGNIAKSLNEIKIVVKF